jgi:hypothetical protein
MTNSTMLPPNSAPPGMFRENPPIGHEEYPYRPKSPVSDEPPRVLPVRGPLRNRYLREQEEAKERERSAQARARGGKSAAEPEPVKVVADPKKNKGGSTLASGLGYGSAHPGHFAYTRAAPLKGVFHSDSRSLAITQGLKAAQGEAEGSNAESDPRRAFRTPGGSPDPQAFVAAKKRFEDPVTLAAPQSLGCVLVTIDSDHSNASSCPAYLPAALSFRPRLGMARAIATIRTIWPP